MPKDKGGHGSNPRQSTEGGPGGSFVKFSPPTETPGKMSPLEGKFWKRTVTAALKKKLPNYDR